MASRRYRNAFPSIRSGAAGYEAFARTPLLPPLERVAAEARTGFKHLALRGARAVIVPSQRTARELRLLHGIDATVVRGCLPSSLLMEAITRDRRVDLGSDRSTILSVCRLEPVKRIDLLLRAFAIVRRDVPGATLIIAGAGSDEHRLREIATKLRLDGCVRFAGYVPDDALWDLYASADVLAAPAMADFIIAPYEAMAMGCRVVWTTEMETDPAIAASGQVFVAPPEDAPFARAIVDALCAPADRRADLRSMTWEARAERLESLLANATMTRATAKAAA
jgi:glycosyltransferase involved in cell wall biosynthesis